MMLCFYFAINFFKQAKDVIHQIASERSGETSSAVALLRRLLGQLKHEVLALMKNGLDA
jgi:hypothetical protein